MKRFYCLAFAAALALLPASLPAQTTPDKPATAAPLPAASPTPEASPANDTPPKKRAAARPKTKSLPKAMTKEEIDHSIESGTVPSRYRKQVPKEYQQYVPFEKQ